MEPRTLAFVAIAWLGAAAPAQDVASQNRRFEARLRPFEAPTEIEVVDLDVGREPGRTIAWRAEDLDIASTDAWCLTDDGKAFVAFETNGAADRPLVWIVREGKLVAALGARELSLPSGGLPNFGIYSERLRLRETEGSVRLDFLASDEVVRSIDLVTGAVAPPRLEPDLGIIRVEPEADPASGQAPHVSNWLVPDVVFSGEPVRVHVRGNLPTPAHRFAGFTLRPSSSVRGWLLAARMLEPAPGTVAPQVLEPFDQTASVFGFEPGEHRLAVAGSRGESNLEVRVLSVLPPGVKAYVATSGGIAGIQRSVEFFDDGRVKPSDAPFFLATNFGFRALARIVDRLPSAASKQPKSSGADLISYRLVWIREGRPVLAERDDLSLEPELREFVRAMEELSHEHEANPTYTIDTTKSFIEVHTGSGGLLSAFGHDHKIMVRRLSGTVLADPGDLASASVVLAIDAGSLAVVDDDSAKDRAEIEREMNEHVLEVSKHPAIRFDGRKVESTPTVDGAYDVVVSGELSLHGRLRRIRVPGRLELREDSLRFTGRFALLQSDYGIEPTSAVGGTVKVADKVRIGFDVTAVRESRRGR